jgi:hypothetical protein
MPGPPVDVRNLALTVVAVLAVVLVLQYAQSVLNPIVIAVLISYALAPFKAAQRIRQRVREHRRDPDGAIQKVQQAAKEIDMAAQEASAPTAAESRNEQALQAATGVQKVEIADPPFSATDYLWSGSQTLAGFATQPSACCSGAGSGGSGGPSWRCRC